MSILCEFYGSTIGKKIAMAVSGLVLVLFALGHMVGNLKLFLGMDASGVYMIDHYAHVLRTMGSDFMGPGTALWIVRLVLLGCVLLHAVSGVQLWLLNRAARPQGYNAQDFRSATMASRTMFYGGLFLALFIVFHILHFTTGQAHAYGFIEGRVYHNVYAAFVHGYLVLIYVAAMFFLALHLFHGTWSLFQTLGIDTPLLNTALRNAARVIAVLLFIGFSSVPVAIYTGALPAPNYAHSVQAHAK